MEKVFGVIIDEDKFVVKTFLQLVFIPFARKKKPKKTSIILNVFSVKKKTTTSTNILKKRSQKISIGFDDFYISNYCEKNIY